MQFTFEYPIALLLLLILPCFIFCKRKMGSHFLPKLTWIPKKNRFIHVNTIIRLVIFILCVVALSEPIFYTSLAPSDRKGINIVLALDTSGSMRESGFLDKDMDKSKFELLQEIIANFIDRRTGDNIGIVAFGSFAFTACPISYDHIGVKSLLNMLEVEIAGKNTAIGEGIAQSIHTLSFGSAKEKLIILVTDGKNNSGKTSPKDAVLMAKNKDIKIYTIGFGSEKSYDKKLLNKIAQETGGKSFAAVDAKVLQDVYAEINRLLPSPIRSENYLNKITLYPWFLIVVFILLFWYIIKRGIPK